ncbi:YicC/YloC family endoribonuclease [Lunatimonas salinarum]|uniref:YicC/YloC family endoribonuclease n=1 Tax=Lunatimonas salinarum TaxID=1774590 RepID=UPI001ADECD64|nr:YicC/YloC family endoribonuclease [Lunatimonas salinarum]
MIKSMTGYGIADFENDQSRIQVEVKTLNSKFLDLSLKFPKQYAERELEVRKLVSEKLVRGKVSLIIEVTEKDYDQLPVSINQGLFQAYVREFKELAGQSGLNTDDLFRLVLQSPNVLSNHTETPKGVTDWNLVLSVVERALQHCDEFRLQEGASLFGKFEENMEVLKEGLEKIRIEEPIRKSRIKDKIRNHFSEWLDESSFDQNRFEQELIYYFEKLDITEEIVRLETHLKYFTKVIQSEEAQGKKLGFIGQEIGREINTIGSKANDVAIQQTVIQMKDELEKIKEQVLNIL